MKKIFIITSLLFGSNTCFAQLWYKVPVSDIVKMSLRGDVKSLSTNQYDVVNVNGTIQNGKLINADSYIFDTNGRIIRYSKKKDAGSQTYRYGTKGNIIEQANFGPNDIPLSKIRYQYDDCGNMINDQSGTLFIYGKDDAGTGQLERIQNNGYQTLYTYDQSGNQLSLNMHDNNSIAGEAYSSKYDNLGNEVEHDLYRDVQSKIRTQQDIFTYNSQRNKIGWTQYDYQNNLVGFSNYKYDSWGNQTEWKSFRPDGSLGYNTATKYDYDKNHNWIRKYEYQNGIPIYYTERIIAYYNSHLPTKKINAAQCPVNRPLTLSPDEMLFNAFFYESFIDNRHNWPLTNISPYHLAIENYKLDIGSLALGIYVPIVLTNISSDNDWYILSTLNCINGDVHGGYGLSFAYRDAGNLYMFEINTNGQYRVCRYLDSQFYVILPWTAATSINKGYGQKNTLKIRYRGDHVCEFYVNRVLVDRIDNFETEGDYSGYMIENSVNITSDTFLVGCKQDN